ncbi:MAG TPA: hypothetical protein VGV37_18575, partial [Aliidongia sp.]|uniref:hypothetical protein n=1 Tax=Aliidongia sp. TaxID=1914230 RepID=UPI002DDD8008
MTVDWDRIERWKGFLLENETGEIETVFRSDGARGPSIKWRPTVDDLQPKVLKFALDHWDRAVVSLGAPRIRLVD